MELAASRGIKVLEDCAQAHGARIAGRAVGAFGDAAAFSFCQDKIISTLGEGGLFATDDEQAWEWSWSFKDHGKTWNSMYVRTHDSVFRWVHDRFGTNWRLTEPQSAVGRLQLAKLAEWVARRRALAARYDDAFAGLAGVRVPVVPSDAYHAFYKYYAYLRPERLRSGWTRDRIVREIVARGAPCFAGSCSELYREHAFDGTDFRPSEPLPVARQLGDTSLQFLVHPTLSDTDVANIADVAREVIVEATA
jgi:dTDP-4-amino-4,6-dideoxygalactose transaminase